MRGDRYSQFVGWMKILLPLAALVLLSTLFLFARRPVPEGDIPYAEIEDIARDPRVTAPAFAGVTDDGSAVTLTAATIRPEADRPEAFGIADFRVEIVTPGGDLIEVMAAEGAFDGPTRQVSLTGLARVVSSSGYVMETTGLVADLGAGTLRTLGPLEVRAPYGQISAGILLVEDGGNVMVFNGGVRLLYQPGIEGTVP